MLEQQTVPQGFCGTISATFKLWWSTLIPLLLLNALTVIAQFSQFKLFLWARTNYQGYRIFSILLIVIIFVLTMLIFNTMIVYLATVLRKKNLGLSNAFDIAKERFLPYLGLFILLAFISSIFLGAALLSFSLLHTTSTLTAVLITAGAIVTFIVFTYTVMASPSLLIDGTPIIASIKRSCRLVWGNWWSVMLTLLFLGIVIGCINIIPLIIAHLTLSKQLIYKIRPFIQMPMQLFTASLFPAMLVVLLEKLSAKVEKNPS